MYKLCSLMFGVLFFASLAIAEEDPIREDWVSEDMKFVSALTKAYQQHPLDFVFIAHRVLRKLPLLFASSRAQKLAM